MKRQAKKSGTTRLNKEELSVLIKHYENLAIATYEFESRERIQDRTDWLVEELHRLTRVVASQTTVIEYSAPTVGKSQVVALLRKLAEEYAKGNGND